MADSDSAELIAAAKDAASRGLDYYTLLGLEEVGPSAALTRETVQRAWRKRSLKYHPDKAGDAFDRDKWELFGHARDVLADAAARAAYDNARTATLQRQREKDLMSAKRRQFVEELEAAEGKSKKASDEEARRRAEVERERARQAELGRQMMEERRRKVAEAEERERERSRKEDEERDQKIADLERKIAEKAKRRAEKKARKDKERNRDETVSAPSAPATPPPPPPETIPKDGRTEKEPAIFVTQETMALSEDPVAFWETQWPKTKARLLAAQAVKDRKRKAAEAAAEARSCPRSPRARVEISGS